MSSKEPLLPNKYIPDADIDEPPNSSRSCWQRFSKALLAVVAVCLLFNMFAAFFPFLTESGWPYFNVVPWGPSEDDGRILGCANLTPNPSIKTFQLPISTSKIFLFSRGSLGHGSVNMRLADLPSDTVEIEVITSSRSRVFPIYKRAKVCHLDRDKGGQGVGIYTRRIWPPYTGVTFDVTIRFPRTGSPSATPFVVNSLETDMGIWSHQIGLLERHINFKSLSLSSANAKIHADSVLGETISCKTGNGEITGYFNVSNAVKLATSNAAISAALCMQNRGVSGPATAELFTSNGRIESSITLVSNDTSASASPANFSVIAKTSNAPVQTKFLRAPSSPFSHLNLDVTTSNAAAHTTLHSTYEGSISLQSSILKPALLQNTVPTDPSGKGRQRTLKIQRLVRGALEARVWWGEKDEGKGSVSVTTSNAYNTLELG